MTVSPKNKKPVHVGLSITRQAIELAVFSPKTMSIEQAVSMPTPVGLLDEDGDVLQNPALLKEVISQLLRGISPKPMLVHLSLPGTLIRVVEMPRLDPSSLYVSLSSEAERYKTFDNTEAIVDFVILNNPNLPPNQQQLVFGAIRSDTLGAYLRVLKELRVRVASIGLEPLNILRAMAGTGVLDGLVQQIGSDACWGMVFVEPNRVRLSVWQQDRLIELRETAIETRDFETATDDSIVVEDLLEEIRRTTKSVQPALWLTQDMPPVMERILSIRLGCAFHSAPLGELPMPQPLHPAVIGAAMTSSVVFPFDFDISAGLGKSGASPASMGASDVGEDDSSTDWLIPAGVGSLVLGGLATAGLFVAAMIMGQQVPPLEAQRDNIKLEVAGLESRQRELKKKAELDQTLMDMIKKAKVRNHVYVSMTEDLKRKTPERVWIRALKVDDGLEISGKAMHHQSVINFARTFDLAPYTKAVLINNIKEERLNGTLVYDFIIGGGINLDPALLNAATFDKNPVQAPLPPGPGSGKSGV